MFSVLFKLKWFFREYRYRYLVAVTLLIMAGLIEMIPPKMIGSAIDTIREGNMTPPDLYRFLGQFFALIVLIYAVTYYWMYRLFGGAFLVERLLRSRLMRHFLKMAPPFYEKNRTGDLMARATNDLKAVSQTAGFGILTLIDSTVFMLIIIFTMGFMISWKLTLAAMLPLPFIVLAMRLYGKTIHRRFTEAQSAFGVMNDHVLESVSGLRVLRAYVQEKADLGRFRAMTGEVLDKNVAVARVEALFQPTIKILIGTSYLIGLGYGAWFVFHNRITLGELVSFNVYLGMLIWPMFALGELINIMQRGDASLDRVNATLSHPPDVKDKPSPVAVGVPETIRFERVTFCYPTASGRQLEEISFAIRRGQTLGIVGPTGSGKTTLLKQLLREYPAGEGSITVNGIPLEDVALERVHSWIGYVPQDPFLFSRTIEENIRFGKKDASDGELRAAIEAAAFAADLERLPDGLNTKVGERGVSLSGGQKQRISIARALIADPEILLLDDALSAVDAHTEKTIVEHLRRLRKNKTTIITCHRLSAVQHADQILVLNNGRIAEQGTHEQLMKRGGWYRDQYERQQILES